MVYALELVARRVVFALGGDASEVVGVVLEAGRLSIDMKAQSRYPERTSDGSDWCKGSGLEGIHERHASARLLRRDTPSNPAVCSTNLL